MNRRLLFIGLVAIASLGVAAALVSSAVTNDPTPTTTPVSTTVPATTTPGSTTTAPTTTSPAPAQPITRTILEHGLKINKNPRWKRLLSHFKVPPPPGYINFYMAYDCGIGEVACMNWTMPDASVRLDPQDGVDPYTFAHELGHVFDMYVMSTTGMRAQFAALLGTTWKTPRSEESFADAYALCAYYSRITGKVKSGYGYWTDTPQLHPKICGLIRSAYASWLATPADWKYGQVLAHSK